MRICTFLMFEGNAEAAIDLYVSLLPGSKILEIERYGDEGPGARGTVKLARFELAGQEYAAIDSPIKHEFAFTPAISLSVKCDLEKEVDALFDELSTDGHVLMPLGKYPFSSKYCWITDRFGVSWQISIK